MSLVPDYDASDSSEESEIEDNSTTVTRIYEKNQKLPIPEFIQDARERKISKSIFANPFVEAENAETAKLERHVKMVNKTDNLEMINGKKICWNHRKGKCRFGHNCKYAHDTELQKPKEQLQLERQIEQTVLCQSQMLPETSINDIKQMQGIEKRKRPGLSRGLVPNKKVMKNYFNNK